MARPDRAQREAAEAEQRTRLYGPWQPLDLPGAQELLQHLGRPWWVVGGRAIDAFTGDARDQSDLDVSLFAPDLTILRHHLGPRWQMWSVLRGALRPVTDQYPEPLAPDARIWLRADAQSPWVLDVALTPGRRGQWVSPFFPDHQAPLDEVTWTDDAGIRHLNPEIVLLFKALGRSTRDDLDLDRAWPLLDPERQAWLRGRILRIDASHPWLGAMR